MENVHIYRGLERIDIELVRRQSDLNLRTQPGACTRGTTILESMAETRHRTQDYFQITKTAIVPASDLYSPFNGSMYFAHHNLTFTAVHQVQYIFIQGMHGLHNQEFASNSHRLVQPVGHSGLAM
jgi:hypothetical protein